MSVALKYLRSQEWSMGNGQCPECEGLGRSFAGREAQDGIGHELNCKVAAVITELSGRPIYKGSYTHTPREAEDYARHVAWWKEATKDLPDPLEVLHEMVESYRKQCEKGLKR